MASERVQLVGCGVLSREVALLVQENRWPLDTDFLDSALHVDLDGLAEGLASALARHPGQATVVFYGACHPNMDKLLEAAGTFRLHGQNCVEMLLGERAFAEELSQGAFFLLEDWALRWREIVTKTFGTNLDLIRDIFQGDRKYLLCLRTPCSGDFETEAAGAGRMVGLPVRWRDVSLDHLASVVADALRRRGEGAAWQG